MGDLRALERWRSTGMLRFNGDPDSDTNTHMMMAEGDTLFMLGNLGFFSEEQSKDEFAFMPYLSVDGTSNTYIANVTKYIGLNKKLQEKGNEQKLEDALHVMEVLCTVDGMHSLSVNTAGDVLLQLRDFVIEDDSNYKPIESALNEGYVAPSMSTGKTLWFRWAKRCIPLCGANAKPKRSRRNWMQTSICWRIIRTTSLPP